MNVKREGCPAEWVIVYREEMDRRVGGGVGEGYIYSPVEREIMPSSSSSATEHAR